ncbi:MAG: 5'-3' exonuclease [Acidimicrobiia bacterium]
MQVHLLDGTYELFRHYFAVPSHHDPDGVEVAAVRGVLGTVLTMLEDGATHLGAATDHVIESFRNDLWPGYKTSAGIDPELLAQFPLLEEALEALGVRVWAMVEQEADDALAAAAAVAAADQRVEQVLICTPDKDLAQCVADPRVAQLDRRHRRLLDEAGVREKFGVGPSSIPDWLALVGDSADGFPGLPGWGAKSAAAVLARYEHLEKIPERAHQWDVSVRGAMKLAATLTEHGQEARLFLTLATLRTDAPVGTVDDWRWAGPTEKLAAWAGRLGAPALVARAERVAERRG